MSADMADSPIEISGQIEGLDEIVRKFRAAPEAFERYMRRFLQQAVLLIERQVKLKTPINTGALRSSIGHEIRGLGAQMEGVVGTSKEYAPFVELDTRPHWPPAAPIQYWAQRKLKLAGADLARATFYVRSKIALVGTRGKHMFQQAFDDTQARVKEMWSETWSEAVQKEL
jgi:hypothetical protein